MNAVYPNARTGKVARYLLIPFTGIITHFAQISYSQSLVFQITTDINQIQQILTQLGPALSAVLFILAGIIYATGQMLPPDKKAQFHTSAVNIVIGAIVVGALSVASTSLATASTHLLSNITTNAVTNIASNTP